jgi:hypothetical protein
VETLSPELVEALRHGRATRERKIAVCSGGAHLQAPDRAEILAVLAHDADEVVATRAQDAFLSQPIESVIEALARENVLPALFGYAAKNLGDKRGVADAMARNKNCGGEYLTHVARALSAESIQVLMEELERVSESPALAAALEHSSSVTAEQKALLHELRGNAIDHGALAEAALEAEPDLGKRQTLLQRLATMTVAQRVQFAIKGGAEARRTLIRDSNKVVQRAVLQSPRLTDQEVEAFAAMSALTDEILRLIAKNRNFRKNYVVVRNLMNNPKTPLDVSLHMLPILNVLDLKRLCVNKNIPETLRSTAQKLHRQRQENKR